MYSRTLFCLAATLAILTVLTLPGVSAARMIPSSSGSAVVHDFTVFQAYPGDSKATDTSFAGLAPSTGEVISAVPGVLQIVPGDKWVNLVSADPARQYGIKRVTLTKHHPTFIECDIYNNLRDVNQGTGTADPASCDIRLWWPLMYEAPGTKWTLQITWTYIGEYVTHTDTWTWTVDADFASAKNVIKLFHELPFGMCEVPLISHEVLFEILPLVLDEVQSNLSDLATAQEWLLVYESLVGDFCITDCPVSPLFSVNSDGDGEADNVGGLGIANTRENPACCKLLVDAEYLGFKYKIFGSSK